MDTIPFSQTPQEGYVPIEELARMAILLSSGEFLSVKYYDTDTDIPKMYIHLKKTIGGIQSITIPYYHEQYIHSGLVRSSAEKIIQWYLEKYTPKKSFIGSTKYENSIDQEEPILSGSWRILSLEQVMDDAAKNARRYMQALQESKKIERTIKVQIQSQVASMFNNPLTQKNKSRLDYFPTEAQRQKLLEAFGEWDSQGIKFNKIEYEPRRAYWVIYFERDTKTIECKVTVEMAENRTVGELQNSLLQSIALSLLSAF